MVCSCAHVAGVGLAGSARREGYCSAGFSVTIAVSAAELLIYMLANGLDWDIYKTSMNRVGMYDLLLVLMISR